MKDILSLTDEQVLEEARKLRVGYGMKRVTRFESPRDESAHTESNAEHVFALFYLAEYFLQVEEVVKSLDVAKLHQVLLFHDFGEMKHGDISYHLKTDEHRRQEHEDAIEIFNSLPTAIKDIARASWQDYEAKASPEARFANAIDKMEPMFELFDEKTEATMKKLKFTYEMHITKKLAATRDYPVMRRFVDVISADMRSRGVFWEDVK